MKQITPTSQLTADKLVNFLKTLYPNLVVVGSAPTHVETICPTDNNIDASPNSLSFIRSKDSHQINKTIAASNSGSFLVSEKSPDFEPPSGKWILRVPEPQIAYIEILENFFLDREESYLPQNIHSTAIIDKSAMVAADAKIGAYVVIGANCVIESEVTIHPHVVLYQNVKIGTNATLHAHSIIREHSVIGRNCIIQPGAVLGGDGFGYVQDAKVGLRSVPQVGTVELADNVDIGCNTCIDRAASGVTQIGTGTKIDNQVQIGHHVNIGAHCVICGQVGIGGSTKIGNGVVLGGKVGVADHMKIVSGARIGAAGIVISHVEEPGDYMGYPVQIAFKWRRILAAQLTLPEFFKSLRKKKDAKEEEK